MRRVEALDSRVNDNIDKTDAVITKLRTLDLKLFHAQPLLPPEVAEASRIAETRSKPEGEGDTFFFLLLLHGFMLMKLRANI